MSFGDHLLFPLFTQVSCFLSCQDVNKQSYVPAAIDKSLSQCQGFHSMMDWIPEPWAKINVSPFQLCMCAFEFVCQLFGCNDTKKEPINYLLILRMVNNNYQNSSETICKFLYVWGGIFIKKEKLPWHETQTLVFNAVCEKSKWNKPNL